MKVENTNTQANHFLNKHKNTETKRTKTSKERRSYVNHVHHVPHEGPVVPKAGQITDLTLPLRISQAAVKLKPHPPITVLFPARYMRQTHRLLTSEAARRATDGKCSTERSAGG